MLKAGQSELSNTYLAYNITNNDEFSVGRKSSSRAAIVTYLRLKQVAQQYFRKYENKYM